MYDDGDVADEEDDDAQNIWPHSGKKKFDLAILAHLLFIVNERDVWRKSSALVYGSWFYGQESAVLLTTT